MTYKRKLTITTDTLFHSIGTLICSWLSAIGTGVPVGIVLSVTAPLIATV